MAVAGVSRRKISVVGSGRIGSALALLAGLKELGDIVLFDVVEGMPQGMQLDLGHMSGVEGFSANFVGTNEYSHLKGSDAVIVTAGVPRKPNMTRDDLVGINSEIIRKVADGIKKYCPDAFVICLTNPLDAMVQLLRDSSGLPPHMVCGMSGALDSSRFKHFLAEKLKVAVQDVQALVMGGHGDTMVPLQRYCTVGGIPLPDLVKMGWISQTEVDEIVERTRNGGGEIVALLKTGSAFIAPAGAAIAMVESFLKDKKRVIPCAAYLNGEYGVKGIYVGVPCIIGAGGVEKVVELQLTDNENEMFKKSIEAVNSLLAVIPKPGAKL